MWEGERGRVMVESTHPKSRWVALKLEDNYNCRGCLRNEGAKSQLNQQQ